MSAVRAELPSVEWLTDDQLIRVDAHQLVGTHELLDRGALTDPWPVRLRESVHRSLQDATERTMVRVADLQRLLYDLQWPVDLRHHSEVSHHVGHSFEEVVDSLSGPIDEQVGRVVLACDPGRITVRPRRFEAEGLLRLPASYPGLPVRLAIEPWWRDRCVVGISLRSSRRLRYPRRYFRCAHSVLSQLTRGAGLHGPSC